MFHLWCSSGCLYLTILHALLFRMWNISGAGTDGNWNSHIQEVLQIESFHNVLNVGRDNKMITFGFLLYVKLMLAFLHYGLIFIKRQVMNVIIVMPTTVKL